MNAGQHTVQLPIRTSVLECAALQEQLVALIETPDAVLIDITDVELVDTAALQLLFAFDRERATNDLTTIWHGDSAPFRDAASALGLPVGRVPT